MGNSGSISSKANVHRLMMIFTKWDIIQIDDLIRRASIDLSDSFALRLKDFHFLLGHQHFKYEQAVEFKEKVFDTSFRGFVDKGEFVCAVCLTSKLSSFEKVDRIFKLFNFNNKGYLLESEISLLINSVSYGAFRVDQSMIPPSHETISHLVKKALSFAKINPGSLRRPELLDFCLELEEIKAFLNAWVGHSSQVLLNKIELWQDVTFPFNHTSVDPRQIDAKADMYHPIAPQSFYTWRRMSTHEANPPEQHDKDQGLNPSSQPNRVKSSSKGPSPNPVSSLALSSSIRLPRKHIFTHRTRVVRGASSRLKMQFLGPGILGQGTLRKGLLADKWFLNGIAMLLAKPENFRYLFAKTDQEDRGRFCVRFYEGEGWRSVFVDDVIPFGPDLQPLFSRSSDPSEMCIQLLEKGLAKYLGGNYRQISEACSRLESVLAAMRLLTGGHPQVDHVRNWEWESLVGDVKGGATRDAVRTIQSLLAEGSLVGFGLSEAQAFHYSSTPFLTSPDPNQRIEDPNDLFQASLSSSSSSSTLKDASQSSILSSLSDNPHVAKNIILNTNMEAASRLSSPHGFVFPVVGVEDVGGRVYIVLKDVWGVIQAEDKPVLISNGPKPNKNNAKQTSPEKKIEGEMFSLDHSLSSSSEMALGLDLSPADEVTGHCRTFRLPVEEVPSTFDSMFFCRLPDSSRVGAEKEGLRPWASHSLSSISHGIDPPACIRLEVKDPRAEAASSKPQSQRRPRFNMKDMTVESTDTVDRVLRRVVPDYDVLQPKSIQPTEHPHPSKKSEAPVPLEGEEDLQGLDTIEVLISASSSYPWGCFGTLTSQPTLCLALLPDPATRDRISRFKRKTLREKAERERRLKAQIEVLESVKDDGLGDREGTERELTEKQKQVEEEKRRLKEEEDEMERLEEEARRKEQEEWEECFEIVFCLPQSWHSFSAHLLPGVYYLYSSLTFSPERPPRAIRRLNRPAHLSEFPWLREVEMDEEEAERKEIEREGGVTGYGKSLLPQSASEYHEKSSASSFLRAVAATRPNQTPSSLSLPKESISATSLPLPVPPTSTPPRVLPPCLSARHRLWFQVSCHQPIVCDSLQSPDTPSPPSSSPLSSFDPPPSTVDFSVFLRPSPAPSPPSSSSTSDSDQHQPPSLPPSQPSFRSSPPPSKSLKKKEKLPWLYDPVPSPFSFLHPLMPMRKIRRNKLQNLMNPVPPSPPSSPTPSPPSSLPEVQSLSPSLDPPSSPSSPSPPSSSPHLDPLSDALPPPPPPPPPPPRFPVPPFTLQNPSEASGQGLASMLSDLRAETRCLEALIGSLRYELFSNEKIVTLMRLLKEKKERERKEGEGERDNS